MLKGYYFITDTKLSRAGNVSDVKNALAAGVKMVQYRNKDASTQQMYVEALKLKALCSKSKLIINDRLDIALAANADGVHLGIEDLPIKTARRLLGKNKIIGITVHNAREAKQAEKSGADYIGVSPIFATGTKSNAGRPVGTKMIKAISQQVAIPVIAIGGINLANAQEVVKSGADGLCAISAVLPKPDVRREIEKFQALFSIKR